MSLFCIILKDNENLEEKRTKSLEAHLNYLRTLKHDKKLIFAGPLMDSTAANAEPCGNILVVNFENEQAVKDWLSKEPFNQAGVYQET